MAVTSSRTTESGEQAYAYVVGSPYMFSDQADQLTSNANLKIFTNIVNECVSDDASTVVVPAKSVNAERFIIKSSAGLIIFIILLVVVPVALLVAGFVIWAKRRKR